MLDPPKTEAAPRPCPGCARPVAVQRCDFCGCCLWAGGYTVDALLAQTPHSRVYTVHDAAGAPFALKELHFASVPDTATLDAFEREAATLQQLDHPGIPRYQGNFREREGVALRLYLAFAWVPGESLATRLGRGTLNEAELVELARRTLEVLVYLQQQRPAVLHRDVKPANLVLGPNGALSLVDFGSVRHIEGSRTHRSTLVGTFGYMPPEQLGGTAGLSSDVYGLASTLVHAATGKPPAELFSSNLQLTIPAGVPQRLRPWLTKALQANPSARFKDAAHALDALNDPGLLAAEAPKVRWLRSIGLGFALGVPLVIAARWKIPVAEVTFPDAPRPGRTGSWFEQHKDHCNPVEVRQLFRESPPPSGTDDTGYGAACLALAGNTDGARKLIYRLQPNERYPAVKILFELVHPLADKGDDAATGPIMKLVVEIWPNNYMALYHLGIAEYVGQEPKAAKEHLEEFLRLYTADDGFGRRARATLEKIAEGVPASPGESSAH